MVDFRKCSYLYRLQHSRPAAQNIIDIVRKLFEYDERKGIILCSKPPNSGAATTNFRKRIFSVYP